MCTLLDLDATVNVILCKLIKECKVVLRSSDYRNHGKLVV